MTWRLVSSRGRGAWLGATSALLAGITFAGRAPAFDEELPRITDIQVPRDRERRIALPTNFGLVASDDDGASWSFVCTRAIGRAPSFYRFGPAPQSRIFAKTFDGFVVSNDLGCSWAPATAAFAPSQTVVDLLVDPLRAERLFAVVREAGQGESEDTLHASNDGGVTFVRTPFVAPRGFIVTSGAVASSDSDVLVLTAHGPEAGMELLARSEDGGATWQTLDVGGGLGSLVPFVLGIDPEEPRTAYLRLSDASAGYAVDHLGVVRFGEPVRVLLRLETNIAAFLRRSDRALLVSTHDKVLLSQDAGATFIPWPSTLHVRALAERSGVVYAAGVEALDEVALGASKGGSPAFTSVLRYEQIAGPRACGTVPTVCADEWEALAPKLRPTSGCGCRLATAPGPQPAGFAAALGLSLAFGRRWVKRRDCAAALPKERLTSAEGPRTVRKMLGLLASIHRGEAVPPFARIARTLGLRLRRVRRVRTEVRDGASR